MIPKGDLEKIDRLVESGRYASRADFAYKAVFLLLTAEDGRKKAVDEAVFPTEKVIS